MINRTLQCCFLTIVALLFSCNQKEETVLTKLPKDQRIAMMAEQEIEMTKHPVTGKVPSHTLSRIRSDVHEKFGQRADDIRWEAKGPNNVGGRTRALLVDSRDSTNNTILAGSISGGLWRLTNALSEDRVWTRVESYTGNPSVSSIAQNPTNPDEIYIGTGEGWFNGDAYRGDGIYKSSDGGITWNKLDGATNTFHVQKILFDANNDVLACTRSRGVIKSSDQGATWREVLSNSTGGFSSRAADIEMTTDGTLFAGMGIFSNDGIYRSADNGDSWEFLEIPVDSIERIELAVTPANPNVVVALLQDENTRAVAAILKTSDKGDNWTTLTVPGAVGMDNFGRNQAWYDMSVAIDPNNEDNMYIGGVDLHKTTNGGITWSQVSIWYPGTQFPEVHADQHYAAFVGGDSDFAIFSNDGGIYYSQNASDVVPDFVSVEEDYITTQFYACDIHPGIGVDYYLAGAQDNGTNRLTQEGVSQSTEVIGGDGAFCHIDQLDPSIQIAATQRGNYYITTDGWGNVEGVFPDERSYFINPTTYDSRNKMLFASYASEQYLRVDVNTRMQDSVRLPELFEQRVSALAVHPSEDLLFLGTNGGDILRVENIFQGTPTATILLQQEGAFARSIEVDPKNTDRIIVTYSNFGVNSVYVSNNGGQDWLNAQGDLPDMPVRWAIFNPSDATQAIIATEVGVWRADITVDEPAITWEYISGDIGTARVNMLKHRKSDEQFVTATYGRGLYTTDGFASTGLSAEQANISLSEGNADAEEGVCGDISTATVVIRLNDPLDEDLEISVALNPASTAIEVVDFDLPTDPIIIAAGEDKVMIDVLIYDNAVVEADKAIILDLTSIVEIFTPQVTINIVNDDAIIDPDAPAFVEAQFGEGDFDRESMFNGWWEDVKSQFLYSSDVLADIGLGTSSLNSLTFQVTSVGSDIPYQNYTIRLSNVSDNELNGFINPGEGQVVYQGTYTPVVGLNEFVFDQPFNYNGTGSLLVEICFDNSEFTGSDRVLYSNVDYLASATAFLDGGSGCELESISEAETSLPDVMFRGDNQFELYEEVDQIFTSTVAADQTASFREERKILASIACVDCQEESCVNASLQLSNSSVVEEGLDSWVERVYTIDNQSTSNTHETTIYFSNGELGDWYDSNVEIRYSEQDYAGTVDESWSLVEIISDKDFRGLKAITFIDEGSGTYVLAKLGLVSTDDPNFEQTYDEIRYFNILGQKLDVTRGIASDNPQVIIKSYLLDGQIIKSEKVVR